jgi:actin related protein 2/3 complex subunit 3
MNTLALGRIYLPGEAQFPLNAMYARPANRQEEGESTVTIM